MTARQAASIQAAIQTLDGLLVTTARPVGARVQAAIYGLGGALRLSLRDHGGEAPRVRRWYLARVAGRLE